MNFLKLILTEWKLTLLAMVIASSAALWMRLQTVTAQRDLAQSDLANYKAVAEAAATTAKTNSDNAIKEINDAIPKLVETAKSNAYKNYLAKHGTGNSVRGSGTDCVRPADPIRDGEAGSASETNEASGEQLVIEACARDAGRLDLWIEWAEMNQLPVSKE
jgi:hypothetical protein